VTWLLLIAIPIASALAVLTTRGGSRASTILLVTAAVTSIVAAVHAALPAQARFLDGYLHGDATVQLFAPVINFIFAGIAVYLRARVATEPASRRFVVLALAFLAASNLALVSNHLLVMWIGIECTTLSAALMIVRADAPASRLASWRYLLFSSVGLGLVVLGLSCLTRSMELAGQPPTLFLDAMPAAVASPTNGWRELGVGLVVLGIGTKLGLAPMYSWLPEAYDEAPAPVTAMLGAVQFNCALVLLFRIVHIYRPGSSGLITGELLAIGLASVAVSTASIVATRNFKRLLAYASINHAGVIAIGLGLPSSASYGLLLYVLSNAFIKAILFLTAGKIEAHYGTKDRKLITGLIKDLPYSGLFLMVGTFALLGFPPFGSFLGELLILSALVTSGQMFVFATFCVLITASFVATGRTIFPMIWAEPKQVRTWPQQRITEGLHKLIFLVLLLVLGIYIPPQINSLMTQVAASLEGP
jgi:hydrogenase-4 component F